MKLYLGGPHGQPRIVSEASSVSNDPLYIFESIYYIKEWMFMFIDGKLWNFMLDSGAFTFMKTKQAINIDWDDYVDRYSDFILEHDVELFHELDIDVLVGLKRVEQLRDRLETRTRRQCLPVWHRSRGLNYWKALVKDYQYVSIGGLVMKEIKRTEYKVFRPLCDIAHEQETQVHGLGFSPTGGMKRCYFDSTDSTNWSMGGRAGYVDKFNGSRMVKALAKEGAKLIPHEGARFNFHEWVKYQRYMKHAG